jgi:hypothetical protein
MGVVIRTAIWRVKWGATTHESIYSLRFLSITSRSW